MTILGDNRLIRSAIYEYDFAVDGGAVGTIVLRGTDVPLGSTLIDSLLDVIVPLTGGTVTDTVSLGYDSAVDVQAAAARNAAPWSTVGPRRGSLSGASAVARNAAQRRARLTINGTGLTAGRLRLLVWYVEQF